MTCKPKVRLGEVWRLRVSASFYKSWFRVITTKVMGQEASRQASRQTLILPAPVTRRPPRPRVVATPARQSRTGNQKTITPPTEPISQQQVKNHDGGFVYKVDDLVRLARLFCLGTEGGTYYVGDEEMKLENAQCILRLIQAGHGAEVVKMAVEYSVEGRTAKQQGLMLAMAICARQSIDPQTKRLCYEHLHEVCRIPTHLFIFLTYCEGLSAGTGWGRAHRRAIANWYLRFQESPQEARRLAMLVTKYRNRNGWSHQDVVRLAHPKPRPDNETHGVTAVLKYVVKGFERAKDDLESTQLLEYFQAVEDVRAQRDPNGINVSGLADIIREHRLVREHINTQLLQFPDIWEALLEHMPITAMIRNLGKMSSIGMLTRGSSHERTITNKLENLEALKKARIHPFNVLVALLTYKKGKGDVGSLTWSPNRAVLQALDDAFYLTFKLVEPTNKRYLLAVDVSGSMYFGPVNGCKSITPGMAAAALFSCHSKNRAAVWNRWLLPWAGSTCHRWSHEAARCWDRDEKSANGSDGLLTSDAICPAAQEEVWRVHCLHRQRDELRLHPSFGGTSWLSQVVWCHWCQTHCVCHVRVWLQHCWPRWCQHDGHAWVWHKWAGSDENICHGWDAAKTSKLSNRDICAEGLLGLYCCWHKQTGELGYVCTLCGVTCLICIIHQRRWNIVTVIVIASYKWWLW